MLDLRSRQILAEFSIQTSIGIALMLLLFIAGAQSWLELGRAGVRVFAFYSVIDCLRAAHTRVQLGGRSLNRWDQAAAYAGCACLLQAVVHYAHA